MTDELSGDSYRWGQANYVRLDPAAAPAHIFTVKSSQPASLIGRGWSPLGAVIRHVTICRHVTNSSTQDI